MSTFDNYIFYTQEHFMRSIGYNPQINLLSLTKQQILDNALAVHKNRINDSINNKFLTEEQQQQVEDLLKGDWVNEFNRGQQNKTWADEFGEGELKSAIENIRHNIKKETPSISTFTKQLSTLIDTVEKYYAPTLKQYSKAVVNRFIEDKTVGSKSSKGIDSTAGRILETLKANYQGRAFRVLDYSGIEVDELSGSLGKLAVLKSQLNTTEGRNYLKNLGADGRRAFWKSIFPKVQKWIDDFNSLVGEIGEIKSLTSGTEQTKKIFDDFHYSLGAQLHSTHRQKGGSGIYTEMFLREDKRLFEDFNNIIEKYGKSLGTPYSMLNNASDSKADSVLQITDNEVIGSLGFSIKEYQQYGDLSNLTHADIHLQSNSTMLTLLLRESAFSYQDLIFLINIAASTTDSPNLDGSIESHYDNLLQSQWDKLKEQLLYRSFYAALAGLGGQNDRVFFMGLNGKIISITDIINNIKNNTDKAKTIYGNVKGRGFDRSVYQKINKNNFDIGPRSKVYGEYRSEKVRMEAMREMQLTKIDISIRLNQLQQLLYN